MGEKVFNEVYSSEKTPINIIIGFEYPYILVGDSNGFMKVHYKKVHIVNASIVYTRIDNGEVVYRDVNYEL